MRKTKQEKFVRKIILPILLALSGHGLAQVDYRPVSDIPVIRDGRTLADPFAGGLNAIQAGTLDVDGDGQSDVVIFERFIRKVMVFRRTGGKLVHDPFLAPLFPEELSDWMLLRDFNGDGRPDLFTGDPLGVRVFVNTSTSGSRVRWRDYHPGFPLLTKGFTANINIKVNADDVPAIDDIDGDGDIDFLATRFTGIATIEYHRNMSMERTGAIDSMQFERSTQYWGEIEECGCGSFAFGGPCMNDGSRQLHTGGKSLLTLDIDQDGDKDLIMGEENCMTGYLLLNKGNPQHAAFDSFEPFPMDMGTAGQMYASAFLADIDGDRISDLVISNNFPVRHMPEEDFASNLVWYRNLADNETGFRNEATPRNLLQPDMIDIGDQAFPAAFDYDGDGDSDLLAGTYNNGLAVLKNTGTTDRPELEWQQTDFLNLRQEGFLNIRPQFTDITGDGRPDLVMTATSAFSGIPSLYCIRNTSDKGFAGSVADVRTIDFPVSTSENIRFRDMDNDGLPDLLRFNGLGILELHRNLGGQQFALEEEGYAGLGEDTRRRFAPFTITDLDRDGREDLLIGLFGKLECRFDLRGEAPRWATIRVIRPESDEHVDWTTLGTEAPVAVHWFGQASPAILTGTALGGIRVLQPQTSDVLPKNPQVSVYPNPSTGQEAVRLWADRPGTATVYTITGQRLTGTQTVEANTEQLLRLPDASAGVYVVRFISGNQQASVRLIRY